MKENIKKLRKKSGLSQQEFAAALNVHQTAVSQWETGRTTPDIEILTKMARLLGVTVDCILGGDKNQETKILHLSEAETALLVAYRAHPEMHEAIHRLLGIEPKEDNMWLAAAPKVTPAIIDLDSDKVDIT